LNERRDSLVGWRSDRSGPAGRGDAIELCRKAERETLCRRREGFCRFARTLAALSLRPFFDLEVEGAHHVPGEGPFLLLAKHQRWEDIPLLGLSTPKGLYYVAKVELFAHPVGSWVLRSLGGVPLNRQRPLESRRHMKRLLGFLRSGEGVVVFPEGTYYPKCMGPGLGGIVRLVLGRLEVPLVPAGFEYTPKGRRTRVVVRFGPPLQPPFPAIDSLMQEIMHRIALLSGLDAPPEPHP